MRLESSPVSGSGQGSVRPETPLLVALDVDGTLCNDGSHTDRAAHATITVAVRSAVRAVQRANSYVVLCTGRLAPATLPFLRELDIRVGYAVCSNGAIVVDAATGAVVHQYLFPLPAVVADLQDRLPGAVFVAEDPAVGVRVTGPVSDSDTFFGTVREVDVAELALQPTTRLAAHWPDHTTEELVAALTGFVLPGLKCWVYPGESFLDLTAVGVSKASALEFLRAELGVPIGRTLAVGDGTNDMEMLRWAGWGVAMGQAPAVVQAAADEVCPPVTEDGVAAVLAHWFPSSEPDH
ncbi:Cof-type HAD-IIB family hydrolase [Nocardia sp. NBC_00881]|uniref:HAD family hydrolase n=1 Tax=Nocardia sp. NBC_00881 TaxID=2975995 RepID=UPI0038695250|nr:Cof-type HAD-IIB family hydrolase [Nocardia sp. NBC_00881]